MIIKPIKQEWEFDLCARIRNKTYKSLGYKGGNIALNKGIHELDAYDLHSFHLAALQGNEMHACIRVVNNTLVRNKFESDKRSCDIINSLTLQVSPKNSIPLQEHIQKEEFDIINDFFNSLRDKGKTFNETGRLIRAIKIGEKHLSNYMLCYVSAFCKYFEVDYSFFIAIEKHCVHYQRFFNCEFIFKEIKFTPFSNSEPLFMMQSTINDLPPKMNEIVNRITDKFHESGGPCAIKLDEIR